uniref:Uncharacterized protein n=1 Tax=Medicago truncatula TaxID=3880 RepID=I3SXV5_MEDTR|nr:unknown [Medicago truncatula]
MLGLLLIKYA